MIIFCRQSIIVLIILLQLFAPLLHAHSGTEINEGGLHIPGLELLDKDYSDTEMQAFISDYHDAGIVVGICSGIHRPAQFVTIESSPSLILPRQYFTVNIKSSAINYGILSAHLYYPKRLTSLSLSRAPPQFI